MALLPHSCDTLISINPRLESVNRELSQARHEVDLTRIDIFLAKQRYLKEVGEQYAMLQKQYPFTASTSPSVKKHRDERLARIMHYEDWKPIRMRSQEIYLMMWVCEVEKVKEKRDKIIQELQVVENIRDDPIAD